MRSKETYITDLDKIYVINKDLIDKSFLYGGMLSEITALMESYGLTRKQAVNIRDKIVKYAQVYYEMEGE